MTVGEDEHPFGTKSYPRRSRLVHCTSELFNNGGKILACRYQQLLFILSAEDHVLVYWSETLTR